MCEYQTCGGLVEEADERLADEGDCHRQTPLHPAAATTQHVKAAGHARSTEAAGLGLGFSTPRSEDKAAGHARITEAAGATARPKTLIVRVLIVREP